MVGVTGFEPAASTSQTSRATNCATPRYAIKLWSCKWSNMWSGTNLTAFLIFTNCPKSAPLKGFRRFFFSGTEWEIYAPKAGALPPALHLDIFISTFFLYLCFLPLLCPPSCGSRNLFGSIVSLDIPTAAPKNARFFCHRQRSRFLPKAGALPPALHLDTAII